jgi:hypothetical protein
MTFSNKFWIIANALQAASTSLNYMAANTTKSPAINPAPINYQFFPLVVESFGSWSEAACK